MATIARKSTGSTLTAAEFNILLDKVQDGADSISTGSVIISGVTNKILSPAGIGSPTTWGAWVQAGSGVTSAGSIAWVVFGTAYSSAPKFIVSSYDDTTPVSLVGSPILAGSAHVISSGVARRFSWISIGQP